AFRPTRKSGEKSAQFPQLKMGGHPYSVPHAEWRGITMPNASSPKAVNMAVAAKPKSAATRRYQLLISIFILWIIYGNEALGSRIVSSAESHSPNYVQGVAVLNV